jgi:hypothetical protein
MLAIDKMKILDLVMLDKVLEKFKNQRSYQDLAASPVKIYLSMLEDVHRDESHSLGLESHDTLILSRDRWEALGRRKLKGCRLPCRRVSPISKLSCRSCHLPQGNHNIDSWRRDALGMQAHTGRFESTDYQLGSIDLNIQIEL